MLIEKLKSDLMQIRRKIEAGDDNLPIELGLPKVLFDIENEFSPYAVCISTARFISLVKTCLSKSDINVAVQKPIPSALRKVSELDNDTPDKGRLEKGAIGIFRMVTESYIFEKSALGQELLSLRAKVREFASTLATSE